MNISRIVPGQLPIRLRAGQARQIRQPKPYKICPQIKHLNDCKVHRLMKEAERKRECIDREIVRNSRPDRGERATLERSAEVFYLQNNQNQPTPTKLEFLTGEEQDELRANSQNLDNQSYWVPDADCLNLDQVIYKLCTYNVFNFYSKEILPPSGLAKAKKLLVDLGVSFYTIDKFITFLQGKIRQNCDLFSVEITEFGAKAVYITPINCTGGKEDQLQDSILQFLFNNPDSGLELPLVVKSIHKATSIREPGYVPDLATDMLANTKIQNRHRQRKQLLLYHVWGAPYKHDLTGIDDHGELITAYLTDTDKTSDSVQNWLKKGKDKRHSKTIISDSTS